MITLALEELFCFCLNNYLPRELFILFGGVINVANLATKLKLNFIID
ncbi:hypothetical protein EV05_0032 [Prochlorococcus sp. MIT 0601]|nr:hypothetical protein EV05_0032 [Prochlorococcus sp. MIT 0601]